MQQFVWYKKFLDKTSSTPDTKCHVTNDGLGTCTISPTKGRLSLRTRRYNFEGTCNGKDKSHIVKKRSGRGIRSKVRFNGVSISVFEGTTIDK